MDELWTIEPYQDRAGQNWLDVRAGALLIWRFHPHDTDKAYTMAVWRNAALWGAWLAQRAA